MEQQFKMRRIEDAITSPETEKEDLITVFLALQRQCFVLGNNMNQLLQQWNKPDLSTTEEVLSKFGITSETKDYHLGNAVKYICRAGHKDSKIQDLQKAIHYLENELQHALRDEPERPSNRIPGRISNLEFQFESGDATPFDR